MPDLMMSLKEGRRKDAGSGCLLQPVSAEEGGDFHYAGP